MQKGKPWEEEEEEGVPPLGVSVEEGVQRVKLVVVEGKGHDEEMEPEWEEEGGMQNVLQTQEASKNLSLRWHKGVVCS